MKINTNSLKNWIFGKVAARSLIQRNNAEAVQLQQVGRCKRDRSPRSLAQPKPSSSSYLYMILCVGLLIFLCACHQTYEEKKMPNPTVTIRTTEGNIQVELLADKAPITVENFLHYVDEKHYNKTVFHRVIDGFMVQGGGFTADMTQKPTHTPIKNEASNGVSNKRGTLAMARTSEIHSATSQFFINVVDNDFLDYKNPSPNGYGYCVFGKVISGMDIVDKIKATETSTKKGHQNVPIKAIEIIEITRE